MERNIIMIQRHWRIYDLNYRGKWYSALIGTGSRWKVEGSERKTAETEESQQLEKFKPTIVKKDSAA